MGQERPGIMARKPKKYPQYNWRVNPDLLDWIRAESMRQECAMADLIEQAVTDLKEKLEPEEDRGKS